MSSEVKGGRAVHFTLDGADGLQSNNRERGKVDRKAAFPLVYLISYDLVTLYKVTKDLRFINSITIEQRKNHVRI